MQGQARDSQPDKERHSGLVLEVTNYDGTNFISWYCRRAELDELDWKKYDCRIAPCLGKLGFRNKAGKWIEHCYGVSGIGSRSFDIIRILQDNPGVYLKPGVIARSTWNEKLYSSSALSGRICAVRRAFGESGSDQHFFLTATHGPLAYAWAAEKTWIRITISTTQNNGGT